MTDSHIPATCCFSDASGLPAHVVEAVSEMVRFYREHAGSEAENDTPEAFELFEEHTRENVFRVGRAMIRGYVEERIVRDGVTWYRARKTPFRIMTSIGPVTFERARYRSGRNGPSLVPVNESLGLVIGFTTRPAAAMGPMAMGHGTAREAEELFRRLGGMSPSASTPGAWRRSCRSFGRASARRPSTRYAGTRPSRGRRSPPRCRLTASWRCGTRRGREPQGRLARSRLRHGVVSRRRRQTV